MNRPLVWMLFALAACRHEGATDEAGGAEAATAVVCAPVRSGHVEDVVSLRGVVNAPPNRRASVASVVAGRLLEVRVREGDRVARGAVVAVVEGAGLLGAVIEADAAVTSAEAGVVAAESALVRAKRLLAGGIAARRDVEDAEARAAAAAGERKAARARREVARQQLERASVRAPIAGTVLRVLRPAGELVDGTPATPVLEIADLSLLELSVTAPAADLTRLVLKAPATVQLDALPGVDIPARVVALSPAVDPITSLGVARISLQPPDPSRVRIGLAGVARIELAARDGVALVPQAAVRRAAEGVDQLALCRVADGGEATAEVRTVKLGVRAGPEVEVVEGVLPGELVVVEHMMGLEDGSPISLEKKGGAERR